MFTLLIALLSLQRVVELAICRRNRAKLRARGGIEYGQGHYPAMVAIHVGFYASLILEYHFVSRGWDPFWPFWLAVLVGAELLRVWVMASLGPYWSTRIVLVPGARLVATGPYRFIRHPNYIVVTLELLSIPMMCGAYVTAVVFSALNLLILRVRIREEEKALAANAPSFIRHPLPRFVPRFPSLSSSPRRRQ
ncbi:MAG: hypothetical protein KIT09_19025 [Bryobacteraceae bacterium]|nr:hypothetical protein [Bryobacteraceae bacterium]